jgi:hypothetical protein
MRNKHITDPLLYRQHIKLKYGDLVWKSYLHKDKIDKLLNRELHGSLNSIVQLFLQYVVKEWSCPNCLQTVLPFLENCYKDLPEKGDIVYVSSRNILTRFPVLSCPHCETQMVIATNEYSDVFEFRYRAIKNSIYDLAKEKALTASEIEDLDLILR